jgi:hypothetical protein
MKTPLLSPGNWSHPTQIISWLKIPVIFENLAEKSYAVVDGDSGLLPDKMNFGNATISHYGVVNGGGVMMRPSNDLPVVYLCRDAIDFRKGINGLSILVEDALRLDPFSEQFP